MNYLINIQLQCVKGSFSASALGEQGEWSRGINTALENLLNKLLIKGLEGTILAYEQNKEIPSIAPGPSTPGSDPVGEIRPPPGPKTGKKKHGA